MHNLRGGGQWLSETNGRPPTSWGRNAFRLSFQYSALIRGDNNNNKIKEEWSMEIKSKRMKKVIRKNSYRMKGSFDSFSTIGSRIFTPLNFSDSIVNSTDDAKFQLSRGPLLPDINKFDESSRHKLHSRLDERDKCFNRNVRQSS